ncbi:MAG TPA: ABC transporter ATP-binding protein [Propionibacteriaceae bacterium]|nr:ABC transporter ATP-binding protein [Propionibacteriaceae bacterium]
MTDVVPRHALPAPHCAAIECHGLTKDYGGGRGLFDLDLVVGRGEIVGFIGPNGAGKTTTIRLLMDLIRPTRGTATVLGLDAHRDSLAIKRRVGYLPGELAEFPGAKARHVLALLAGLRGGVDPTRILALADRLQLELGRKYADLSHGNKQKVGLIQAFMHRPELLILDEPTLGLDPLVQREFWLLVREAAADGASVLLSSHVLAEVENGCDRIALIRAGRLIRAGSLAELRDLRTHRVDAVLTAPVPVGELALLPGVSEADVAGERVSCSVQGPVGPLVDWLAAHDVVELDSRELSLEEVFLREFDSTS